MVIPLKTPGLARIVGAAFLCICAFSASAATVSLAPAPTDPTQTLVTVEGPLLQNDELEFWRRVGSLTKAIVSFNSDGGNLLAGIEIGKAIRLKSFGTVVLDGKRCASACAFAWLGGTPRFMGNSSLVGFHAAYIERGGRATETGVGNALLGSYLNQIGLSQNALVYITMAAPTEMTWLNFRDAKQIGIDVAPWPTPQLPSKANQEPSEDDLSNRARAFVIAIQSRWSDANSTALNWLDTLYAPEVDYYGKRLSRDAVLAEKRQFAERWPERAYKIKANSMMAHCSASECVVTGNIEWEARSRTRNAASSGMATFAYVLAASGGKLFVHGENGTVLQLRTSTLSPPER